MAMFCLAVGLTAGSRIPPDPDFAGFGFTEYQMHWHFGLLATGSTAMIIGLVQQAIFLRRKTHRLADQGCDRCFSWKIAVGWRLVVAFVLFSCIVVQILICRQNIRLPEVADLFFYGDLIPNYLWWLAIVVVLSATRQRYFLARETPLLRQGLFLLLGLLLILHAVQDMNCVAFLVHLATSGVEGSQPTRWQRHGTFLPTTADQMQFYWYSVIGAACWFLGSGLWIWGILTKRNHAVRKQIAFFLGFFLLGAATAYCWWYYSVGLPSASPDLAEAMIAATAFGLVSGGILGLLLSCLAAYCLSVRSSAISMRQPLVMEAPAFLHESRSVIAVIAIANGFYMIDTLRGYFSFGSPNFWEVLRYSLTESNNYLTILMLILSLQILWYSRTTKGKIEPIRMPIISKSTLATCFLAVWIILAVGMPTLAAYGFSHWFRPWYSR